IGSTKGGESLQDAFAKFREQKKSERRLLKACRVPGNRSQEFKDQLRSKFIAQAHTYLGIPYHEKYREEGTELAPLYLDCCGLVRKCLQDLKEDFGFLVGRWNQAYQMDTLPQVLSFDQLKPGDLVFYEGTFTSKRSKVQKHNNVHVEIFLGGETGEATIGARFQKGVVTVFPSYKFESKSWTLIRHHFRSIDTWLDGQCVSHCTEHPWISESGSLYAAAGRRSIFNDQEDGEEAAGDYDDDPEPEPGDSGGDSDKRAQSRAAEKEKREMLEGRPLPKTYYVHKSNGWKLVCAALDRRGWQQLPFEYNMSTRFTLKWVERRSQIDYKAHVAGQLVNHIINNDVFTTKLGLVNTLRDFFCRTFDDMILSTSPRLPTPWLMETYQLDQAIDCAAVLKEDEEATANDTADSIHLWIFKPSSGNRGRGVHVVRGGRELQELVGSYVNHYHPTLISTDTFKDVSHLLSEVATGSESTDVAESRKEGSESPPLVMDDDAACFGKIPRAIIQRYCINPLLVEGYKFDIRCYMLVARTDPGYLAFYHPGYCRFTMLPYSYDPANAGDPFIHLTNAAVQKKHPNYQERKNKQTMCPQDVIELLVADGDHGSADYMRDQMENDMMICMVDVLKAAKVKLQRKSGYFDLFGFDFMLRDSKMPKLLLIETNTNPALHTDGTALEKILPAMVDATLELVLAAN
ncbi:unnamed protein product, partial [Ectocarpus fasciculatus]